MKAAILAGAILTLFSNTASATGAALIEFYSDVNCAGDTVYAFVDDAVDRGKPQTLVDFIAYSIKIVYVDVDYSGAEIFLYRYTSELTAGDESFTPTSSDVGDCFSNNHEGWVHYVPQADTFSKRDAEPALQNITSTLSRRAWPNGRRWDRDSKTYILKEPYLSIVAGKPRLTYGILDLIINTARTLNSITVPSGVVNLPGGWVFRWTSINGAQVPAEVLIGWLVHLRNEYVYSWQDTKVSTTVYATNYPQGYDAWEMCTVTFGVE